MFHKFTFALSLKCRGHDKLQKAVLVVVHLDWPLHSVLELFDYEIISFLHFHRGSTSMCLWSCQTEMLVEIYIPSVYILIPYPRFNTENNFTFHFYRLHKSTWLEINLITQSFIMKPIGRTFHREVMLIYCIFTQKISCQFNVAMI